MALTTLAIGLMSALVRFAKSPMLRRSGARSGTKTARLQDGFVAVQVGIPAVVVICTIFGREELRRAATGRHGLPRGFDGDAARDSSGTLLCAG